MHPRARTGTEDDRRAPSTRALLKDAMSPNTPLKVMLVEDHAAFRQALVFVLKSEQGLEVIAQAGSLAEAREALEGGGLLGRLDVALIDLILPDGEGTELVGELRRADPSIKVIVLSADLWPWRIEELSSAGVDAVLDKVQSPRQIAREVRREGGGG
jgi:DNA-binding NarL/FixJ family response regulator